MSYIEDVVNAQIEVFRVKWGLVDRGCLSIDDALAIARGRRNVTIMGHGAQPGTPGWRCHEHGAVGCKPCGADEPEFDLPDLRPTSVPARVLLLLAPALLVGLIFHLLFGSPTGWVSAAVVVLTGVIVMVRCRRAGRAAPAAPATCPAPRPVAPRPALPRHVETERTDVIIGDTTIAFFDPRNPGQHQ